MKPLVIVISILLVWVTPIFSQACDPELRIFKIGYADVESLYETANNLKSSEGKVSFDRNSNSLVVFDCPQNLEHIALAIKTLDVKEKQIQIKVMVVEATSVLLESIGFTTSEVIIPKGQFSAIAELLKTSKGGSVRSEMTVRTLSNQPARLQVTKEEVVGNEFVIVGDKTIIDSPIREPIGDFLEVLPSAYNDGRVKVVVRPSVTTIDENADPSVRTILTQVVVNSGDTIVIGGSDTEKESAGKGKTLLGVPLSKQTANEKNKVVMFLTATIVD